MATATVLPRYHVVWGTSRELTRCLIARCTAPNSGGAG
jgi:hypothetical protein